MKEICASGSPSQAFNVLIKEAAKCENYASDLIIDLHELLKKVELKESDSLEYWFGFRDLGVDHKSFIECRWNSRVYDDVYRKIYVLCVELEEGQAFYTLYEATYEDLCALKEEKEKNQ